MKAEYQRTDVKNGASMASKMDNGNGNGNGAIYHIIMVDQHGM